MNFPMTRACVTLFFCALLSASLLCATGCKPAITAHDAPSKGAAAEAVDDGEVGPDGPASIDNGGITEVPRDPALAQQGKGLFAAKGCAACHTTDTSKLIGPGLAGSTERRTPQWLARMIMHPEQMLERDPIAKELLREYGTPMTNMNLSPEETKAVIAFLAEY